MRPIARRLSELHHGHTHRAGLLSVETIDAIERICDGTTINRSMETGCGLTTVALSNLSAHHVIFALDDRGDEASSVAFAMNSPAYRAEVCHHVFGPTQVTIPAYSFDDEIDFALIDGPHGFPYPQLEYYYIFPHLRSGALLVIDDINIPHIWGMFACLAEDDMFEFVEIIDGKTGFLRRTAAPRVSSIGDEWYLQRHNFMKWPMRVVPDAIWHPEEIIDFTSSGNRAVVALLGWSAAEAWGSWSDGSEATVSFRWPVGLRPRTSISVEFFYGARADIVLSLNNRVIGLLPGFPQEGMRQHVVSFDVTEDDVARTNILVFKPTATWAIEAFPNKRQYGIALNHLRYHVRLNPVVPGPMAAADPQPANGRVTYSIEAEDLLIERLFYALIERDLGHKGFFMDIGAFDPVRASNTFLFYQKGWSGVNVDPNPEAIRRFRELRLRDTAVHAAIGRDGEMGDYLMFDQPLLNGFLPAEIEALHVTNGHRIVERVPVEFRSVGSLLAEFAPAGKRIDLLNIDVETMEHSILSDWDFSIWRPRMIAIEIHGPLAVTELAKNQAAALLVERGYVFVSRLWHTSIFLDRNSIRPEFLW